MNGKAEFGPQAKRQGRAALAAAVALLVCTVPCLAVGNPLLGAYRHILGVLRQPTANGAVIVDQELPPALLAAGLRPGDIIERIDGRRVLTLQRWQKLAATVADKPAKLQIVRGSRNTIITAGSQINGLHLMMVRAGAAAPLGPVPIARAKIKFSWAFLRHSMGEVSNPNTHRWLLLRQDHYVVGALHLRVVRRIHGWMLAWNLIAVSGGPLLAQRWRIRFYTGNGHSTPAFTLVGMDRHFIRTSLRVIAKGRKLMLYPSRQTLWSTHYAIPMPALFLLADALEGPKGTTAGISEIGFSRLATRRGCTLQVGPVEDVTVGGVGYRAKLVLVHWLALRQARFYFAGHRLIAADLQGGLSAIRIASGAIAHDIIGKRRWIEVPASGQPVTAKGGH